MPIRMVDDNNDNYSNENESAGSGGGGNRGGGGGGLLMQFLPMIIGLFIKNPKLLIIAAVIGGFVFFKGGCNSILPSSSNNSTLKTGGNLDPQEYAKAQVYEGLDESKNTLPEYISLANYAPQRRNQGEQGSCVAWSSAYAARTILESASTGVNPDATAFSPAFMYNQIKLDGCQGSYIIRAMENLTKVGAVQDNRFPYTDKECDRQPNGGLINEASQYKMLGFTRLSGNESTNTLDIHAVKEHLAKDVPVIIGMMVGGTFMQGMMNNEVWQPTDEDYSQMGFGGHAMCVIGYDDRKDGGAFEIMNSWGSEWGKNGIGWVTYKDFKHFVREAYGLDPMPKMGNAVAQNLACSFGLVEGTSKNYISLKRATNNIFTTSQPIKKGSTFKVEVKNEVPCYVYVLGKETDGSSYVLFPYPTKADPSKTMFSPYCGITGYRLFPRGKNLMADEIGTKDYMAIVTSTQPIDVFQLNNAVNANKGLGFENAINQAIGRNAVNNINFNSNNGSFGFSTSTGDKNAVAMIIAIDKF